MTKFNLKKAILENKATFFSSLTEGQFSWITQDTNQQIGSENENTLPFVYMFDNKGMKWLEKNYEGYGVFGNKDYYELLDQMNGGTGDRSRGINLAFDKESTESGEVLYPALVVNPNFNWKSHDFTEESKNDPNQSWYQEPEEEDYNLEDDDDEDDEDEYLQEASADSTPYGNYINKARAKSHLTKKDGDVYGIDKSGKGHKITDATDLDKYTKFTIKSKELNEGKEEVVLSNKILDFLEERGIIDPSDAQKVHKDLTTFLEDKVKSEELSDYDPNLNIDEGKKETPIDEEIFGFPNVDINFPTLKTRYIAKKFAEYMSNKEGQRFTVTLNSPDGPSFDLDLDGEEYDGGSYLIAKNGDIINVALRERPVYGNISMLDETEKPKTKMKKSELKEKIKEMVLSEMESNNMEDAPEDEVDFLAEVAAILAEADKDEETDTETADAETTDTETVDAEVETPEGTEDVEVTDTTTTDQVDPNVKAVQDALTQAQAAAQTLGDAKLTDQIGNTITFFTRTHVVDKGAVAENVEEDLQNKDIESAITGKKLDLAKLKTATEKAMGGDSTELTLFLAGVFENKEYYNDADINALEKDMKDDKDSSMKIKEVVFPMWQRIK